MNMILNFSNWKRVNEGIDVGSNSGTITVGQDEAYYVHEVLADDTEYEMPFNNQSGERVLSILAEVRQKNGTINYEGRNLVPTLTAIQKLMDSGSVANWNKLMADHKHVKYGISAAAYYMKTADSMKWTNVFVGSEEYVEQMKKANGTEEWREDVSFPISFPIANPAGQHFIDNTAILTDLFKGEITSLIEEIKGAGAKSNPPIANPQFFLSKLTVSTSSSRFRNTNEAANKTWLQLSEERANVAQKYVIDQFTAAGIIIGKSPNGELNTQYIINANGENGDGTSGPNPPKGFAFNSDGLGTWDCTKSDKCTEKNRNDKGAPLTNKAEYDKFKYLICTAELIMKNPIAHPEGGPTPGEPDTNPTAVTEYTIAFYRPKKGVKIPYWYPTIDVHFKKLNLDNYWNKFVNRITPGSKPGPRTTKCFF